NLERAAAPTGEFLALPGLKVLLLPIGEWGLRPDPTLIHAVWVFGLMVGVLALIGKHTNAALLALAASVTFLIAHRYSYGYIHHPDGLMALYLWVLAFSPCGRRWSLDELEWRLRHSEANGEFEPRLAEDEASMFARWPLVLGQWLLAVAYFSAGTSKIIHGGVDWFRSSTLAHYLVQDGVRWDSRIGLFMAGMPEALVALAVFTVLFEATFFIAILEPRSTWLYLLGGAALHVGILITMRAPFIQWVTLYVVFIENLRRHWPLTVISRRLASNRRWTLIHDGGCSPSVRS